MSPFVAVKHFFHLGDIVKVPHDVSRSEAVAGLYIFPVQFLDEADITALMAPRQPGRIGSNVFYFYRDDVAPFAWNGPTTIIATGVTGNPSLIQAAPGTY